MIRVFTFISLLRRQLKSKRQLRLPTRPRECIHLQPNSNPPDPTNSKVLTDVRVCTCYYDRGRGKAWRAICEVPRPDRLRHRHLQRPIINSGVGLNFASSNERAACSPRKFCQQRAPQGRRMRARGQVTVIIMELFRCKVIGCNRIWSFCSRIWEEIW